MLSWTDFAGATSSSYIPTSPISSTTFVRRCANDGADTAYSNILTLLYIDSIPITLVGIETAYCSNDGIDTIIAVPGSPAGTFGMVSGFGLTDNLDATAYFDPSVDAAGIYSVYYEYTDGYGCVSSDTFSFDLFTAPTVFFSMPSIPLQQC